MILTGYLFGYFLIRYYKISEKMVSILMISWSGVYMYKWEQPKVLLMVLGLILIVLTIEDLLYLSVPSYQLNIVVIIAFFIWILDGCHPSSMMLSILFPLFLHGCNQYKKMIGSADVILIWINCWLFGFVGTMCMLLLASFIMLFVWVICKKKYYPFVPILSFSMHVMMFSI